MVFLGDIMVKALCSHNKGMEEGAMKKCLRRMAVLLALVLALSSFALAEGELLESPTLSDEPVVT